MTGGRAGLRRTARDLQAEYGHLLRPCLRVADPHLEERFTVLADRIGRRHPLADQTTLELYPRP